MATLVQGTIHSRPKGEIFYVQMAVACLVVAVLGFLPTFWLPVAQGQFHAQPVVYVHGLVFTAWCVFFIWQAWLAETNRLQHHRAVGLAGVSLATLMVMLGVLISLNFMKVADAGGQLDAALAFSFIPLSSIAYFAAFFTAAIAMRRRREWHKRLMLVTAISILSAAIARWGIVLFPPPGPPAPPPPFVDVPPSVVAALLIAVAMLRDRRVIGRVHPAYTIGIVSYLALKAIEAPFAETAVWHAVAMGIYRLVGA